MELVLYVTSLKLHTEWHLIGMKMQIKLTKDGNVLLREMVSSKSSSQLEYC